MPCEHYELCPAEVATWVIDTVQISATVHCERCDSRFPLAIHMVLGGVGKMPSYCDETVACPSCGTVFALKSNLALMGQGELQRQVSECPPMEKALCKSNSARTSSRLLN